MRKIALALAAVLALAGCDMIGPEQREESAYDVTASVAAVSVRTGAGDIVITGSDRTGIHVTETLRWRGPDGAKPRPEHPVHGDTLDLRYTCDAGETNCAVDYRVEVPRNVQVTLDSGAGDLTLRDLAGALKVTTGAGDVEATGITTAKTIVDTGAGDLKLTFAAAPEQVDLESGSGDVTLTVPGGPYQLHVQTGAGDQKITIPTDSAASLKITVKTGAGDVEVLTA